MVLWECGGCSTRYRVELHRCPRCHGTEFEELRPAGRSGEDRNEEVGMAKITVHGGASNALTGEGPPDDSGGEPREHPGTGEQMEGVEVPADGTEHVLVGEGELPVTELDVVDYETWTVADLRAEIDLRNEGRAEPLPTTGKKRDLVDTLRGDDATAEARWLREATDRYRADDQA